MSYTRRGLIEGAYAELAIAGWVWDLAPEEMNWANQRLDLMLGTWDGEGLRLGIAIANSETPPDLNEESGCPSWATEAVILNLAVRLAAGKGKALSQQTVMRADSAMRSIRTRSAIPQPLAFPGGVPMGQGNRTYGGRNFTPAYVRDPLPVDGAGKIDFLEPQS